MTRRLVGLGLVWLALEIAGAPLTSGALAKMSLEGVAALAPFGRSALSWLLSLAAAGSAALMLHFLRWQEAGDASARGRLRIGLWLPWTALVVFDVLLLAYAPTEKLARLLEVSKLWSSTWPLLLGSVFGLASAPSLLRLRVPPGDVLVLFEASARHVLRGLGRLPTYLGVAKPRARDAVSTSLLRWVASLLRIVGVTDALLARFAVTGVLFLLLLVVFVLLAH